MSAIAPAGLRNQSNPPGPGAVVSLVPSSLDTCHQPGIFRGTSHQKTRVYKAHLAPDDQYILPWEYGAVRPLKGFGKDEIKELLAGSLEANCLYLEASKVRACQREFYIVPCKKCGLPVAYSSHCHNRLCPDCASAAAELLISEHSELLKQIHHPKMGDLTWLPVKKLTRETFINARKDVNKLRHQKVWALVFAGIGSFEVTWSKEHGWHLHWHFLIGSKYIPQDELSKAWEKITGAPVVWIEAIKNADKWDGIREVVKYPAKCVNFIGSPALVEEFLSATKGLKLVTGFGSLYRVQTKKRGDGKLKCPRCGSLEFDWQNKISVARDRVERWGDAWVLKDNFIRAGPVSGG